MSAKNLSTIANEIIETNGKTAINVLTSYRVGGERLIGYVDQRFATAVNTGAARLSDEFRSNLINGQQRISGFYVKGLTIGTDRAESLVSSAVEMASKGVDTFAANAERFEQSANFGAVEMINRVAVPVAKAASQVAERFEQGSSQLVKRVAGKPVAAVKAKATVAKRKVAAVKRKAVAAKPVKAVKKSVATGRRAVSKTAAKVSAAAA